MGLGFSNDSISSTLIHESFSDTNLLKYYDNSIPSGFSGFLRFDFSETLFKVFYKKSMFTFDVKDGTLSVKNLLSLIPNVALSEIKLPYGLPDIFNLLINDFGIDIHSDQIFVEITVSKTLSYFGNIIQMSNPTVRLEVSPQTSKVKLQASGEISISSVHFSVLIAYHQNTYFLNAHTEEFSISSILSTFSAKALPTQLQEISGSLPFLNFAIKDFNMIMPLKADMTQIFFSGTPVIAGYTTVSMSATVLRKQKSGSFLVLKLDLGNTNLAQVKFCLLYRLLLVEFHSSIKKLVLT